MSKKARKENCGGMVYTVKSAAKATAGLIADAAVATAAGFTAGAVMKGGVNMAESPCICKPIRCRDRGQMHSVRNFTKRRDRSEQRGDPDRGHQPWLRTPGRQRHPSRQRHISLKSGTR